MTTPFFEYFKQRAGWNDQTLLALIERFLEGANQRDNLADFLLDIISDEEDFLPAVISDEEDED